MTKREAINNLRKKIQERSADSTFSNKDLYLALLEQAQWLIKREVSAGRIYRNPSFFKLLAAREIVEVSTIPTCLNIKTNCKIYRTKNRLPEMWSDNNGPMIYSVHSIDNSTEFTRVTPTDWASIIGDPYQKFSTEKYCFFEDGYVWFPKENPYNANIRAYYKDDVKLVPDSCTDCDDSESCVKFLDTEFMVPDWIIAEIFAKALQMLFPTKQLQEDQQIDKNTNRKN
jgi:hypothetical protein